MYRRLHLFLKMYYFIHLPFPREVHLHNFFPSLPYESAIQTLVELVQGESSVTSLLASPVPTNTSLSESIESPSAASPLPEPSASVTAGPTPPTVDLCSAIAPPSPACPPAASLSRGLSSSQVSQGTSPSVGMNFKWDNRNINKLEIFSVRSMKTWSDVNDTSSCFQLVLLQICLWINVKN